MLNFSAAPDICIVSINTQQCHPPVFTETLSLLTDPYSLCWFMRGIYFWDVWAYISPFCEWNRTHPPQFPQTTICQMPRGFSLSVYLRFRDKIRVCPFVVSVTPLYVLLLPPLSSFWLWGRMWPAWLDYLTFGWFPVGWLASDITRKSLLPPYIQISFLRGTLYAPSWWRRQLWSICSSFSQLMHGLAGLSLWWWFYPGVTWWSRLG